MNNIPEKIIEQTGPNTGGPFSWRKLAVWLPGASILGILVAWMAVDAQFYFAPLVIFPLLMGILLGGLITGLMRMGQVGHRPTIILGTVLACLIAVVGQHFLGYLSARAFLRDQSPLLGKARQAFPEFMAKHDHVPPADFGEYMSQQAERGRPLLFEYKARGWMAWLSWTIDGLLVFAGTSVVVVPAMFLPFCSRCQTWYRAIRSAHANASGIKQIGQMLGVDPVEHLKSGRCRLICCHRGCGPTGCELYWEDTTGDTFFARIWLCAADRNRVMQVLDEVT